MYTTLRSFGIRVITIAAGKVFSSALLLFLTGSKRYIFRESVFLFHEPIVINANELGTVGHLGEVLQGERIDSQMFEAVLNRELDAPKSLIKQLADPDKPKFIRAEEALRIKLATDTIEKLSQINL